MEDAPAVVEDDDGSSRPAEAMKMASGVRAGLQTAADTAEMRIEARQREREAEERKRRQREEAMGEVQRREKQERKQDLADAKFLTLARTADDEEMNDRLKSQKKSKAKTTRTAAPAAKVYQGHAAPNRYGIKPGWRWDGVDRGNGFEKEWFQARAQRARNTDLTYQWQEDE
ncbi:hypothetical protein DV735_g3281, partial [Chaetothyriales sp. CBS 134920]